MCPTSILGLGGQTGSSGDARRSPSPPEPSPGVADAGQGPEQRPVPKHPLSSSAMGGFGMQGIGNDPNSSGKLTGGTAVFFSDTLASALKEKMYLEQ